VDIATPFSWTLILTDLELFAALHSRPLLPGAAVHCQDWVTTKRLVQGEIGLGRVPGTVARHEQDRRTIRTALATLDGVPVRLEQSLLSPIHRGNDKRITGTAASGLKRGHWHYHRLLGLASFSDCRASPGCYIRSENDSMVKMIAKLVEKQLGMIAREKRCRHPPRTALSKIAWTYGGDRYQIRRGASGNQTCLEGVHSLLIRKLSFGLLRARGRWFEP
jgi:hypothetical protein